jgi:hypothetical protein
MDENSRGVMGDVQLLFLHIRLQFEWYMTRLVVENGHRNGLQSCNASGLCVHNVEIVWGSVVNIGGRAYVMALSSYNFCNSTQDLELEMTIFLIRNCYLDEAIHKPIQCQPTNKCGVGTYFSSN